MVVMNIAVIIPIYKQYSELSPSEKKSLYNTFKILADYVIVFVSPAEIDHSAYYEGYQDKLHIKKITFPTDYFLDISGYNRLMLSLDFYKKLSEYQYILICQLDVFVFSDKLRYFVEKDYDYIGAPWYEGFNTANSESNIIGVGNGGFSLRKVQSFISVLKVLEVFKGSKVSIKQLFAIRNNWSELLHIAKHEYQRRTRDYETILPWETNRYEDDYWGRLVKSFFPKFRISNIEDAISFAFEVNPRVLYKLNNYELPMGVHAWEKYDPEFWKEFIA